LKKEEKKEVSERNKSNGREELRERGEREGER